MFGTDQIDRDPSRGLSVPPAAAGGYGFDSNGNSVNRSMVPIWATTAREPSVSQLRTRSETWFAVRKLPSCGRLQKSLLTGNYIGNYVCDALRPGRMPDRGEHGQYNREREESRSNERRTDKQRSVEAGV